MIKPLDTTAPKEPLPVHSKNITIGLHRLNNSGLITTIALYALTAIASFTVIGSIFWLYFHSKLKTKQVGIQFFASIFLTALALIPIVGWGILYGVKQYFIFHKEQKIAFQEELAVLGLEQLRAALNDTASSAVPALLKEPYDELAHEITDKQGPFFDRFLLIRSQLDQLIKNQEFLDVKATNPLNPFIQHIEILAYTMRNRCLSATAFEHIGQLYTSYVENKDNYTLQEISNYFIDAIETNGGFNYESPADMLACRILFPLRAFASLHSELDGEHYNSYHYGNIDSYGYTLRFHQDNKTPFDIHFHYGAYPLSDSLYESELDLYESHLTVAATYKGPCNLQANLQKQKKAEGVRSRKLVEIKDQKHPASYCITLPMDGLAWDLSGPFQHISSVGNFCDAYKAFAIGMNHQDKDEKSYRISPSKLHEKDPSIANGFYIPVELMSDEEIEQAFDIIKEIIGNDIPFPQDEEEKKLMARGLQLGVNTLLTLKALANSANHSMAMLQQNEVQTILSSLAINLQEILTSSCFGQACKQDVDRGITANILTRIFAMKIAKQPITIDVLNEMIGTVIGRSDLVVNRAIMLQRFQPALYLLELISHHESAFMKSVEDYLGSSFTIEVLSK
ncbi:MAG: hypothetical protein HY860_02710 [Chlamydiales bacterium]|nr:hypothetical protein [Chlamydiales bacterium]